MKYITTFFNSVNRCIQCMGMKEWAMVGVAVVVVGAFTMKGFGSRKSY